MILILKLLTFLLGLRNCKKILTSSFLLELGAKPLETLIPGCEKYFKNEDQYFTCWARSILFTFHHPVGTCKMGDPNDRTTVVDPELRYLLIRSNNTRC